MSASPFTSPEIIRVETPPPASPPTGNPEPLADILAQLEAFLGRYIVFRTPAQATVIAVWIAHSHAIEATDFTPYLHISSPEKRCGKSRLLDLLMLLVRDAWPVVSPSEAVVYRKISNSCPTLLLDEADTIFSGGRNDENKEGLRALLNAGFQRSATVPRCVGPQHEIKDFAVFCPKVIAGIGKLPTTVADRSVPIILARKGPGQTVEKFRTREAAPVADAIRAQLAAWAGTTATIDALRAARPAIPDALGDRQADICEPLLAIADMAGGKWPEALRGALALLLGSDAEDESVGVKLLAAFRSIFRAEDTDRIASDHALTALMEIDDAPWAAWWAGDIAHDNKRGPMVKLAKLLKPFGVMPATVRLPDGSTPKGYKAESFADAWARYLPPEKAPAP